MKHLPFKKMKSEKENEITKCRNLSETFKKFNYFEDAIIEIKGLTFLANQRRM